MNNISASLENINSKKKRLQIIFILGVLYSAIAAFGTAYCHWNPIESGVVRDGLFCSGIFEIPLYIPWIPFQIVGWLGVVAISYLTDIMLSPAQNIYITQYFNSEVIAACISYVFFLAIWISIFRFRIKKINDS